MAKYTETFAEYVEGGGALPSSFSLIDGFEDLFKETYYGSEIGFETEELFALKLDAKADIFMPIYKARMDSVTSQMTGLQNQPCRVRYESRTYGKQHSETENEGSNTELPYDSATALPANTSRMEGSADTDAHTDTLQFDDGISADERLRIIEAVNKKAFSLMQALLDEFKPLFMAIY